MVRPDNVDHLSKVEALDMELFEQAMCDAGMHAGEIVERGPAGALGLPELLERLGSQVS
ncbi:hypothetical protein [Streptomyces sp. NPDC088847]|uniref:hypothetical protein n=1 Tax=Streptomyces sp. NPDC088847 TaxID=3365909 RepID=UPI00381F8D7A